MWELALAVTYEASTDKPSRDKTNLVAEDRKSLLVFKPSSIGAWCDMRVYVIITEVTSIPLALGGYLMLLSGFCLTKIEVVSRLTLGLLDSYLLCGLLHTQELPLITGLLAVVHSVSGLNLMVRRAWGRRPLLEAVIIALGAFMTLQITLSYYS